MNTAHTTQHKRTIKVKDFLADFRGGMPGGELMRKYNLTPAGLEKFYSMLLEREILSYKDFQARHKGRDDVQTADTAPDAGRRFICPSCLGVHASDVDVCPDCGGSDASPEEGPADPVDAVSLDSEDETRAMPAAAAAEALESDEEDDLGFDAFTPGSDEIDGAERLEAGASKERDRFDDLFADDRDGFDLDPIEIPSDDDTDPVFSASRRLGDDEEGPDRGEFQGGFPETDEEVVSGEPFGYYDEAADEERGDSPACDVCNHHLEAGVRDVYDRKRGMFAFMISAALLVLGFLGAGSLTLFEGYSFTRLAVVYFTGLSMLSGCIFLAFAVFMTSLARERVFYCRDCGRVLPRA